ncbi:MAG: HD domain-containing protein [Blautia sp.]|nr:HD domain-containing protein [Blautia sp.]MCM1200131.1 HD domain-containing protein [Bacteroides fragilis]
MNTLYQLTRRMISYEKGNPKRIQHFLKVHSFAKMIGENENLGDAALYTLEITALVHDIGIRPSEEKYGRCDGKLQEKEGPAPARKMLSDLHIAPDVIDRVCYLVAHHHTYEPVEGVDYRILLEADALVNLYEDRSPDDAVRAMLRNVFRTKTGTDICKEMFGIE